MPPSLARRLAVLFAPALSMLVQAQPLSVPVIAGLITGSPGGQPPAAIITCLQDGAGNSTRLVVAGDVVCGWTVLAIDADGVDVRSAASPVVQRLHLPTPSPGTAPPAEPATRRHDEPRPALPAPSVAHEDGVVHVVLPAALFDEYLANLPALLTSATVIARAPERDAAVQPIVQGVPVNLFEVTSVRPGGVIERLGVRPGDVVLDVNGAPLRDAAGLLSLLNDLRMARHATVGVRRAGDRVTFVVDIR